MGREDDRSVLSSFSHTSNATYLTAFFALCCVGYDSTHDILQRVHINKKWFYLFGATCTFAYLYVRPLIRRRLGSATRGYINYSTVYICWLLMAVFYHLPSLESMGFNIKADVSMWLACFLGSLCVLGLLHGVYSTLVAVRLLDPRLYSPMAGPHEVWSIVLMNSVNLAVACSTFYSFCGNAPPTGATSGGSLNWKDAVCHKWLHPVSASSHSAFTRYVIYGEAAEAGPAGGSRLWRSPPPLAAPQRAANASSSFLQIDYPLDGKGMLPILAADLVSPIFTMWLTLLLMYGANCLADYSAASTLNAAYTADLRRELASRERRVRHQRRKSADNAHDNRTFSWASDDALSDRDDSTIRGAFASLASRGSFEGLLTSVSNILGSPTSTMRRAGSVLFRDDFRIGMATSWLHSSSTHGDAADAGSEAAVPIAPDAPAPAFLPMFPWYSGTSADLLKTLFNLLISVRVFLGRFDMRTMQAAIAPRPTSSNTPPSGGDGFTYEHLAHKDELWWDFVADTGDGGDPTYAMARCMAAPQLRVTVPAELAAAGTSGSAEGKATAALAAGQRTLPRASVVIHGGDLCYPSPTDETFEQRLFGPYEAAFPPPGHVHPGHLVVNKPDLGPEHWAAASVAECRCNGSAAGAAGCCKSCGSAEAARPCSYCAKEAALRAYDGPALFAIPGNHDWIDGLDCFQRQIQHKGWMGGWLMPQEKSYFAVRLPHGWWIFGLDLALVDDIDMCQYSYFARIAEERMGRDDQVILVQHCPNWLLGWFWGNTQGKNLRQLVRGPLRGRARMQLAGDMHFMMRHTFKQYKAGESPSMAPSEMPTPAGTSPAGGSPAGGSPTASQPNSRSTTPAPGLRTHLSPSQLHQSLVTRLGANSGGNGGATGRGQSLPPLSQQQQQQPSSGSRGAAAGSGVAPGGATPQASPPLGSSPEQAWSLLQGSSPGRLQQGWGRQQGMAAAGPLRRMPSRGGSSSELAEAALAALSSPTAPASGSVSRPITIGARMAKSSPALPLLSPIRSSPSGACGSDAMASAASTADVQEESTAEQASSRRSSLDEPVPIPAGLSLKPGASLGTSPPSAAGSPFHSWWPGLAKVRTSSSSGQEAAEPASAFANGGGGGGARRMSSDTALPTGGPQGGSGDTSTSFASLDLAGKAGQGQERPLGGAGWHLNDPEHLVVCGGGGAFSHPTHVFTDSRFRPEYHPAAGPIFIRDTHPSVPSSGGLQHQQAANGPGSGGGGMQRSFPSSSSLYSMGHRGSEAEQRRPAGGEYRCEQAFPSPEQSKKLGRANLTFRSMNNRFDIIGGLLYYLLVISVLPRCTGVAEVLEAHTLLEAAALFFWAGLDTLVSIVTESYISLATLVCVFGVLFGLCSSGGIGALPGVPPAMRRRPEFHGSTLAVRARVGGLATQLVYAGAHCMAHLCSAVSLLLLLELAIEVMMKYEGVGRDGYHSLYKWYQGFEALNFPDPMGIRDTLAKCSLGLYPAALKWVMAVFDVPEVIAVSRTAMCTGGGLAAVTRVQAAGYYLGVLAYYWLLATPTVGFMLGCYLYISVNWFHVHYDEAFSSLQVPHFKGFCRFHITRNGDLEMFGLGLEQVPHAWREDPRWRMPHGGGNRDAPAHRAKYPSRWVPVEEKPHLLRPPRMTALPEAQLKVVDYLLVPKYRR